MSERLKYYEMNSEALKPLLALEKYLSDCGLEKPLQELVKLRASQINGCAYCIDMHTKDARAGGESEQRLYLLSAWREAPFYTDRERAAFEWTEAVTLISATQVPDETYEKVRPVFLAGRAYESDNGRCGHQRMEPAGDFIPLPTRHLSGKKTERIS